ncbi:zeta toxin family protein [Desulfococcaceae bacterium OttesenSCG-928-F15]|nr:zeta toxin family protein [Desulfococcaceae bacterium OttesenSCG-928-F15]
MEECSAISAPHVIIIAGPNGAGKSTTAPILLRDTLAVDEFVNADTLAQGLSAFSPEKVAVQAGRIMLERLDELARKRASFAFETTLASRTFAPWLESLQAEGYKPIFFFCPCPVRKLPYKGWLHG